MRVDSIVLHGLVQCKAYTVGVRAKDCCGNFSAVVSAPFTWDDQAPCLVIETPFEPCFNEPVCIAGYACDQDEGYCCAQCSGVKMVEIMVYDQTAGCWWNGSHWIVKESWNLATVTYGPDCRWHWNYCLPPLVSGHTYCVTVRATDNACNVTVREWGCFLYDTDEPVVEIMDLDDCYGPCAHRAYVGAHNGASASACLTGCVSRRGKSARAARRIRSR